MKVSTLTILMLTFSLFAFAQDKIIGGQLPVPGHPASYNTVALIHADDGKIFCTGSIATEKLIITAKHCLVDKGLSDFLIFFGASTLSPEAGFVRTPARFSVRYQTDWHLSFPSGDIAWVELREPIPAGFAPLRILSEASALSYQQEIILAGYGNKLADGAIAAGEKFYTTTALESYLNNSRFVDVMVFKGPENQGACHGDSGGPAYQQLVNEFGELEWFLIGVTNGFDLVLTPDTMSRTSDPDFPARVRCEKNQILYSFIGGHGEWIERSSGHELAKTAPFRRSDWQEEQKPKTLRDWCLARDLGSPVWNTLKVLLDSKVDSMPQREARDFYLDCEQIASYLAEVTKVDFDGEKLIPARYDLAVLKLLPKLAELSFRKIEEHRIKWQGLSELKLSQLSVYDSRLPALKTLFAGAQIETLNLRGVKLLELDGLELIADLKRLDVSVKELENAQAIGQIKSLESLTMQGGAVSDFSFLLELKSLRELTLLNTSSPGTEWIASTTNLQSLRLSSLTLDELDLSPLTRLRQLALSSLEVSKITWGNLQDLESLEANELGLTTIEFLSQATSLEQLSLGLNQIEDISLLSALTQLRELNLAANPISDLAALRALKELRTLRLFGTPLARGEVEKTPLNCPLDASEVLTRFCRP